MRIRNFAQSQRAGMLALAGILSAIPGWATVGNSIPKGSTVASASGGQTVHAWTSQPPIQIQAARSRRVMNPFERIIGPHMSQLMKQSPAKRLSARRLNKTFASGIGGTNVNFPGFVAAPFLTINNGDPNPTFASVSADFNNDGNVDVATIQADGVVNVILNPGTGAGLAAASVLPPNTGANGYGLDVEWVEAADMNHDGYADLVGQDLNNNQIVVWISKGDGTFQDPVMYPAASPTGANWGTGGGGSIVVGDFNNDGAPDVAVIEMDPDLANLTTLVAIRTYLNKGDGSGNLVTPTTETDATFKDFYFSQYDQADIISNDGKSISGIAFLIQDDGAITPANLGADVIFVASKGDGTFAPPVEPAAPIIQDYYISLTGSFHATNLSAVGNTPSVQGAGKKVRSLVAGGSDGQPTTDIVFMTGDGAVYDAPYSPSNVSYDPLKATILLGANVYAQDFSDSARKATKGTANLQAQDTSSPVPFPITNQDVLNLADMNGDGLPDLILYCFGTAYIFPNTGAASFTAPPIQLAGATGGDQQPQPADFDGSGFNSIAWVDSELGQVGYYQNLGAESVAAAGQFYAAPPVSGPNASGTTAYTALGNSVYVQATADINGDGQQDVIAYDYSNEVANGYYPDIVVGFGKGSPNAASGLGAFTFNTAIPGSTLANIGFYFLEPVAITNSAGTSVLLATYSNGLSIATARAGRTAFNTPTALNLGITLNCALGFADAGDVNGDGMPDIVVAYPGDTSCGPGPSNPVPSGYLTLLGAPDGTFGKASFTPFGSSLLLPRLISFSGQSGSLDLALADVDFNNNVFGVYVVPNKGDGSGAFDLASAVEPAENYIVSDIVAGDYNSDGKQDLTLTTEGQYDSAIGGIVDNTQGVLLLPGAGGTTFGTPNLVNPGSFAIWGSYADFNGDGSPDLALANYSSDSAYYPMVQVLPGLGGGNFGPVITEMDSFYVEEGTTHSEYTFTGNFSNSGGPDLLVTSGFNTAEFVNRGVTAMAFTTSSSPAAQGTAVTLTATLSQQVAGPQATGSVSFLLNGVLLGSSPVSNGAAVLVATALPVGSDSVTATYSGDPLHNGVSATATVTVTALSPSFTLSAFSPATLTLAQGATGTTIVSLAANTTFAGTVQFACAGAPAGATCSVSPASVALTPGQSDTVSVVIATTSPKSTNQARQSSSFPWTGGALGGISMAGLVFLFLPGRRRLRSVWTVLAIVAIAMSSAGALVGCGGDGSPNTNAAPGNSTLTVTATSGTITQSQSIALTVTKP